MWFLRTIPTPNKRKSSEFNSLGKVNIMIGRVQWEDYSLRAVKRVLTEVYVCMTGF